MMITNKEIIDFLNVRFPDARCELNYNKDYELLIATVLSAQSTDLQVNKVTSRLFAKYDIFKISNANIEDIEEIIRPVGTFKRKAKYLQEIAKRLVEDYEGTVPNDRLYLESLPGVGRKVCNVVLANLYDEPLFAVDTHVERVAKRLGIANHNDNVRQVENKLNDFFPKEKWKDLHHQMVLFGRYVCKSQKPDCQNCIFYNKCKKTN